MSSFDAFVMQDGRCFYAPRMIGASMHRIEMTAEAVIRMLRDQNPGNAASMKPMSMMGIVIFERVWAVHEDDPRLWLEVQP